MLGKLPAWQETFGNHQGEQKAEDGRALDVLIDTSCNERSPI
jgi:hypothetical protein